MTNSKEVDKGVKGERVKTKSRLKYLNSPSKSSQVSHKINPIKKWFFKLEEKSLNFPKLLTQLEPELKANKLTKSTSVSDTISIYESLDKSN